MPQAVGRAEGRALPRMAVCRAPLRPFPLGGADILGPGVPAGTHLGRSPASGTAAAARLSEGRAGRARPALPAPRLPSPQAGGRHSAPRSQPAAAPAVMRAPGGRGLGGPFPAPPEAALPCRALRQPRTARLGSAQGRNGRGE